MNFSGAVSTATITLTDTNDTLTFQGNVTATTLNTAAQGYAVVFEGASNQVTNAVTFTNTGGVTLGNGGDVFLFDGGLTSTASTTTVNGTVRTSGDAVLLGAVTLTGNSVVDTTNAGTYRRQRHHPGSRDRRRVQPRAECRQRRRKRDRRHLGVQRGTLTLTQADTATFSGTVNAATMTLTDTNDSSPSRRT